MDKTSIGTKIPNMASESVNAECCSDSSSNSLPVAQNDFVTGLLHIKEEPQGGLHIKEETQDEDPDSADEFYFESDHLCLKTNSDYRRLLKHLFILETKKIQAIKNKEILLQQMNAALADPLKFVERLQNGEDMGFPCRQRINPLPVIDWGKYAISDDTAAFERRQHTRLSARVNADANKAARTQTSEDLKTLKSSQPWTAEEQKKLEDLLIKFPVEKIETRRWEKIANALGNRTATQVASRVQKYFIKLTKAGISVPGRMPNVSHLRKPKRNVIRQNPSTFLVSQTPPVYMMDSDDDISNGYGMSLPGSIDDNSSDAKMDMSDDDVNEMRDSSDFKELMLLKKSLREKLSTSGPSQHIGFKCSRCECEPIIGVRWHCTQCSSGAINLCDDCVNCIFEIGNHTSDHHMEAMHRGRSAFIDRNYQFSGKDYNYLDSNYMPAI